jgi:menaquinone-dependent protoporphyrinogen oxidase
MAGATAEVARIVAEEIARSGAQVDVLPLAQVRDLDAYQGVVVGAPMILGWHRAALAFLRRHRKAYRRIPLAVFALGMSLTQTGQTSVRDVPVTIDENLPVSPARPNRLTLRERYATLSNYVGPILSAAGPAKPVSIGVFGGRLEYGRLKWWAVLFAMVIIQARAGDHRNWPAIRAWAAGLPVQFQMPDIAPTPASQA